MKLKFRADKKDIKIFILFCIVLLYLVAIALCNVVSFLSENEFSGFNPLPAFSKEYFAPTMVFYTLALIFTITSVKDRFFERESGLGVKVGKKEKGGYARWLTEDEMKKELKKVDPRADEIPYGGIPLINNKKGMWVDDSEYHNLIIGSTGAGKTQVVVNPLVKVLAKAGESMIITDPKGEIYEENANMLREKGYNVVLLNFRNPQEGSGWNPLTLPYNYYRNGNQDKAIELVDDLAVNILYDENAQNQDPFWEKTSADYFAGLTLALFEDANPDEINLNSISLMSTLGEEKIKGTPNTYIKEYFNSKDPRSTAYVDASSTLMAPTDTKASILSVFKQKIKLFASRENMSEMLSHSDFDMKDIGRKKTAVFIVIQDEKKTYHSLVTIFIKQCYETLIDVAQESPNGKLAYRTNFILDEFANMPPLKDVTTMVTAARSRRMRFNFIIQNFAQLTQVYGKDNGETIKGNCGNIIYLISSELTALEEISKMCGEKKSKEKEKTASTPLVTVSDLQRLEKWHAIILRIRKMPFKTRLKPNFEMLNENAWGKVYEKASYPHREKKPVQTFDLKGKVDAIRKEKMEKMGAGENPFGGSSPFGGSNPFGGANPFGGGNPFGGSNPFAPSSSSNSSSPLPSKPAPMPTTHANKMNGVDIQEMVRRIDEKIAALEEEERQERLAIEKKKQEEHERQNQEQEKIKRLEEEQKKKDAEEERKRQELRKKQEEELKRIQKENEERKKKEAEERKKREAEQHQREIEEKKRREEEQRRKEEEARKQQERMKQEQEEQERIKREQAERIRREQEELRKKEEHSKLPETPIIEETRVEQQVPEVSMNTQTFEPRKETQIKEEEPKNEIEHEITEDEFFDDFFSDDDDE